MSKSNKTTPNVPTLRFKRYTTEWTKINLSNYLCVSSKRNKDGRFSKEDVLSVSGELGIVNQIALLGRSYAGESVLPYHIVEKGDIVYTKSPLALYPYGIIKTNRNKVGIVSTLYAVYKTKDNANNRFIEHYFSLKSRINNYLKPIVRIGAKHDMKIGNNEVLENIVAFPDISEQCEIADFLDLLDNRISVQNKIISKYETLIKGIRHRIFGSICGEKQSSLGGFLEEYSEKNVANNLQSVAVGKYGIRKREEIYSKELSADYSKNKVIRKNTLIIGMGSTQIDIGILTTDDCYCVSPAYTTYRIKGINSFYLQEYLIELNPLLSVRYMITSARQGKAVNKEDLMKHLMTIHSESEQKEICQCFENLYSRLQIEKEMLSALQKQKAFLLQSMFI